MTAAMQAAPAAVLDRIEGDLSDLEGGIGAIRTVMRAPMDCELMHSIAVTLNVMSALSKSLSDCFEAMSDGDYRLAQLDTYSTRQ